MRTIGIIVTRKRLIAALGLCWIAGALFLHQAAVGFDWRLAAWPQVAVSLACVAVALVLLDRGLLSRRLRRRQARLLDTVEAMQLAEELARMGKVSCDMASGRMRWSRGMFRIHSRSGKSSPTYGEWLAAMPVCGPLVRHVIEENEAQRDPFGTDYHVELPDRRERIVRLRIVNHFDRWGRRTSWSGVAMDITEQSRKEAALEAARTCAIKLAAEAKELSETDALTGLANRRRTLEKLETCLVRARREDRPLAVIAFDLDRFKAINDRYGHQTGDDVLVQTAELARQQIRASDLVGRMGGEEFAWILPDCSQEEAELAAERLRAAIAHCCPDGSLPDFTASIGIAVFEGGDDAQSLLGRADRALYTAKEEGRNRVALAA